MTTRTLRFYALVGFLVFLDQVTKYLAHAYLARDFIVIPNLFRLTLAKNSGAAFSFGTGFSWLFFLLGIIALIFIGWFLPRTTGSIVFLALLQGGIAGNVFDRLFKPPYFGNGEVVDFLNTPLLSGVVFNIADLFILAGVFGTFLFLKGSK
ncbi:lipoprotein signal peptidase [Tropheryma whipplei str. Twist]|uniref:Lipoprotein signal peptidase n=1 Tax=Tropheryma whipplei (strain Twist) TaxID=203267 RepID=LSPA_TROWT|nr:RecName: Full=Lipoprotein signal peptidase; AltName: Full=Prolipoprotein signal peptidase; AltName: Full=Signal peptidase II; Short=SPase II [Tropheryma whipplei str. Twist]AAO44609.1 lipoprotein signal peptidase [Tropheryma whipplei str. Twist]